MQKQSKYDNRLPQAPGIDISNPKTRSAAKGVATKKNNAFRKMVDTKLPLFAGELIAGYTPVTAEKVIERRIIFREGHKLWRRDFNAMQRRHIRKYRAEVLALIPDAVEFKRLIRACVRLEGGDRSTRWYRILSLVKTRQSKPLSPNADLVLAWLQQEIRPVTHFDIYERRGDGLTPGEILNALTELMNLAMVGKVDVVELPERFHCFDRWNSSTAWNWEAVRPD